MGQKTKAKKKVEKTVESSVSYFELFRCASNRDYVLLTCASLVTFIKALVFPFAIIVYSELIAMFIDRTVGQGTSSPTYLLPLFGGGKTLVNATYEENMLELKKDSISFGILVGIASLVLFISGVLSVDLYNYIALNIVVRFRRQFFEATIRQDIGWHDTATDQNFSVRITDNMEKIRVGISENIGHFQMLLFDIIISICIAFAYGWKLTLAVFIYIPIAIVVNVLVAKYQSKLTTKEQNSYAHANTVVEESISAIRTVVAFGGEHTEAERYETRLHPGFKAGKRRGIFNGLSDSLLKAMLFMSSSAAFWYGANLIVEDSQKDVSERDYTPTVLMIVSTGILVSADHISRTVPFLESFATARGSAKAIFDVIDAVSKIDPLSSGGKILNQSLKGNIEFKDIFFRYPTRTDVIVLRGFNLSIKEGQTVALVGYSGSGKSTCVQLLQRFYDPEFGSIAIDGEDIRNYNIGWLRQNIAVVGQEPVLFQGTIEQNIRHGKMDATQKEIEEAAKAAGAHDFIIELPHAYETSISEKGVQLSGGQRQRIAIARALIKNPKILLLDEATSALDYNSEKLVQSALDKASKGRTTLVVSHRLSAICNADHIVFIDEGKIIERGTHEELVKFGGKYAEMVKAHEYEGKLEELKDNNEDNDQRFVDDDADDDDFELLKQRKDSHHSEKFKFHELKVAALWTPANEKNAKNLIDDRKQSLDVAPNQTDSHMATFFRIIRTARPEWFLLSIGVVCAAIYGCAQPAFSIICARFYAALAVPDQHELLEGTSQVALISSIVGIIAGLVGFTQTYLFNWAGISLTTRMRSLSFRAIMRQEVGWFDKKTNSVGALSARLAGDAASVQSAIGFPLSNIIQAFTNFVCSFSIAFTYSWELALICLCTAPFMVVSIVFEAKYITKSSVKEKEVLEDTSRMATETIAQIRTVAGLHREMELIAAYEQDLKLYMQQIKQRLRFRGVLNSLGMAIMFLGYAITIAYGGVMVANDKIQFEDVMKIANTMLYGLFLLAHSLAFTPAFNAAIISAGRLYEVLDREPKIQSPASRRDSYGISRKSISIVTPNKNNNNKKNAIDGVTYQDLYFSYPTRRQQRVLRGFNLEVPKGKTIALVGPSGSGKSTCVQLLQRYYDPDEGKIHINQDNIHEDLSLSTLRRRLGVVSQEPSLFEKTIAENIAYGDTTRAVPMSEIIEAAKMANAHDFICALPNGYETRMGARGTQLSGGQKQRIAIARALIRNPDVLLLDEATSALDLQSERIVQAALDAACTGRTCIVIAHRLSTVHNADVICVIQSGRIVERGSHVQLLAKNGIYAKLYRSQPAGI